MIKLSYFILYQIHFKYTSKKIVKKSCLLLIFIHYDIIQLYIIGCKEVLIWVCYFI